MHLDYRKDYFLDFLIGILKEAICLQDLVSNQISVRKLPQILIMHLRSPFQPPYYTIMCN